MQHRSIVSHSPLLAILPQACWIVVWHVCPGPLLARPKCYIKEYSTYLLDKASQELDNSLESVFIQRNICAKHTEHINELIVYSVILCSKFSEEHASHVGNLLVAVLKTFGHLTKLTFDLDLTSQNKECQCHQTSTFDARVAIVESAIEKVGVLIDKMVKAHSHIAKCHDEIAAHHSILASRMRYGWRIYLQRVPQNWPVTTGGQTTALVHGHVRWLR
jgi:hypothetical protein